MVLELLFAFLRISIFHVGPTLHSTCHRNTFARDAIRVPSSRLVLEGRVTMGVWMILSRSRQLAIAAFVCATVVGVSAQKAPAFKVDPSWPQEMPNHWIMGSVTGVFVDSKQHVWVTHLPETLTE